MYVPEKLCPFSAIVFGSRFTKRSYWAAGTGPFPCLVAAFESVSGPF
jgi:hypothetical protein